jgi:GTP-binding protein Era
MSARDIIIRPIVTEKTMKLSSEENKVTFMVAKNANKVSVAQAIKEIYGISAKNGVHVQDVIDGVAKVAPEGPQYFPEDMITDHPERFLTAEIIREKLLLYLEEEVPHGVAVEIESFEEGEDITRIGAVIYCERKSHKSIIIGKGGRKLKGVGKAAREDIEKLLGCKVFLSLWVKIKERWRDDDIALTNFGYREKS